MTNQLRPEIKKQWLEALRSGKYKQGQGQLRAPGDRYCCLGVLCDLHAKETGDRWQRGKRGEWVYQGESDFLPDAVLKWAGIASRKTRVAGATLDEHNDSGWSFEEIANMIEERL